jgi:hypothetical protein
MGLYGQVVVIGGGWTVLRVKVALVIRRIFICGFLIREQRKYTKIQNSSTFILV